jgi:predicted MFS family arabinose efflux permease
MPLLDRSSRRVGASPDAVGSGAGPAGAFIRDPDTVLAYGAVGCFAYCLYGLGPILAFLRADLHLSYALTTLHSVLWSGGTIAAGLAYRPLVARLGQRLLMWSMTAAFCAGIVLLAAAHMLALTLAAALLMGASGTTLLVATSAILADRHGPRRDRALVEANAGAVAMAVLAPLLFGALGGTAVTWRAALAVPLAGFAVLYLLFRRLPGPAGTSEPASPGEIRPLPGRLPAVYWVRAALVAVSVAAEFCMVFYAAELLHAAGLPLDRAATALALFYLGELTGRLAGARLTGRQSAARSRALVAVSLAVAAAGFAAFWLSGHLAVVLAGLFVTGLGIANLYPLTLGLAMSAAPGDSGRAAARTQVLAGVAVMAAPFALSVMADAWGVGPAFAIEPALIALAVILLATTARQARPAAPKNRG